MSCFSFHILSAVRWYLSSWLCLVWWSLGHPCCCDCHDLFLFSGWVVFHCVCAPYVFIHSSVKGHFGCFNVLNFLNSMTMNVGVNVSFWIHIFSECMSGSGIVGSYGSSVVNFFKNLHTVFHIGCTGSARGCSLFSTPSPGCICILLNDYHSDQCELVFHCSFDLHNSSN